MSTPKIELNDEVVRLRDEEGRIFSWISKHMLEKHGRKIGTKNIAKIYHREKAKMAIANGGKTK